MRGAKIHSRVGYRWRHMCHGYLAADRIAAPCEIWLPDLQVGHWPDSTKSRSGYLALLEAAVAETPDDLRDQFLLGREYVFLRRWGAAETFLRHYLATATARWPQQRASAWRRLERCRNANGDPVGAIACIQEGLRLAPGMRDLWLDLADLHAEMESWRASYDAALRGLAVPTDAGSVAGDCRHAGGGPYYRASLAAWRLGRIVEARALAVEADAREPGNPVYQGHLRDLGRA
jgi:tetratricopeptide (TPR) repeat protein